MIEEKTGLLEFSGRVTPREVLAAYEQTGYTPMQAGFVDDRRACALGAIAVANEKRWRELEENIPEHWSVEEVTTP